MRLDFSFKFVIKKYKRNFEWILTMNLFHPQQPIREKHI